MSPHAQRRIAVVTCAAVLLAAQTADELPGAVVALALLAVIALLCGMRPQVPHIRRSVSLTGRAYYPSSARRDVSRVEASRLR